MMKRTLTAAALATVLAAPAFAQTATPPAATTTPSATTSMPSSSATTGTSLTGASFMQSQSASDWRGSKLIGATVYGTDNSSIGEVNDLILASDGKVNGVVIGVGGFLGVGEKNVAVPFERLTVARKADSAAIDKITVAFTKDELKNAPTYAYFDTAPASTTGSAAPRATTPMGGTPAPSAPAR